MVELNRRRFLANVGTSFVATSAPLGLLSRILPASPEEAKVNPEMVRFRPEIEPVVRWIEETPIDQALEKAGVELKNGLPYRELLAALFLAGIRNIEPRPVGFKFHAVMVVNSAHQLSLDSPQGDRLYPLLWALDDFKGSQLQDESEGDWWLGPPDEPRVPSPMESRTLFKKAMEEWDAESADAAVTGLARSAGAGELMDSLWRYGARNYRHIGHHIIFTAQAFRTLQTIGFQHAEPVLRSLVYGILNGRKGEVSAHPFEENRERTQTIRKDWSAGRNDGTTAISFLQTLRTANETEAPVEAARLLNDGISAQCLWDSVLLAAGELLLNHPGILALHAWTSANSLHFAFRASGNPATRLLMLFQAASWMVKYREDIQGYSQERLVRIDELEQSRKGEDISPESIFETLDQDRLEAARQTLGYSKNGGGPDAFMDAGRRLIYEKGTNAHDYKFSAAAFEEFMQVSPRWRPHLMASSLFNLKSAGDRDSPLSDRIRSAIEMVES